MRNSFKTKLIISIFILLLVIIWGECSSQALISRDRQMEFGAQVGVVNYLGDIQGNAGAGTNNLKDLNLPNSKPIFGAFYVFYPDYEKSRIGWKIAVNSGVIHGADSLIPNEGGAELERIKRNLSFKTRINELFLSAEFYFLKKNFRPYLTTGLGIIQFIPKTYYEGEWVKLAPLKTEGIKYSTLNFSLPIGAGFKYYTKRNKVLTVEVLYRRAFTDYLDDVSTIYTANTLSFREKQYRDYIGGQRGDPEDNDTYFSVVLKYSFLLFQNVKFLRRQSLLCPRDVY